MNLNLHGSGLLPQSASAPVGAEPFAALGAPPMELFGGLLPLDLQEPSRRGGLHCVGEGLR